MNVSGSVDAVIRHGVVNLSGQAPGVRRRGSGASAGWTARLADIVAERDRSVPRNIAAAGLELRVVQTNPSYQSASHCAQHEPHLRRHSACWSCAQAGTSIPRPPHTDQEVTMSTITDTSRDGLETEKLTIRVAAKTSLPPERVLDAGRDFSERRADVGSNVKEKHLEVHELGEAFAAVTEGTWVVGLF